MKTHGQNSYVALHARTATPHGSPAAPRTDRVVRTARGLVILTLALGSLGAAEAGSVALASPAHAGDHQMVSHIRAGKHAKHVTLVNTGSGMSGPWMW